MLAPVCWRHPPSLHRRRSDDPTICRFTGDTLLALSPWWRRPAGLTPKCGRFITGAVDTANLDKYWLCNHCWPTTQIYKITTSDACPTTSCECERAFSSTKMLITPERNLLSDDLIEALECLRAWWNNDLVKRP